MEDAVVCFTRKMFIMIVSPLFSRHNKCASICCRETANVNET